MTELVVLLNDREAGTITSKNGRLRFIYSDAWRGSDQAFPLSLSMPLSAKEHPHKSIEPFIWGLLPDNEHVLSRWAQKYQVSARNAFALIGQVGEDAAGAVQFVRQERLPSLIEQPIWEVDWLTKKDVANRLRQVKADASAGRLPQDTGQFSLAGAQPKTALLFDGRRWGVPSGRLPTTHILKPATAEFDGHAENEHLCLRLAKALGLSSAVSEVMHFEDVSAIVSERYDRLDVAKAAKERAEAAAQLKEESDKAANAGAFVQAGNLARESGENLGLSHLLAGRAQSKPIERLHQEDMCQALAVHPTLKYQNQGGPGPNTIIKLLRNNVSSHASQRSNPKYPFAAEDDVATFIEALIYNWLIGGTDAHAKNYSLIIGSGGVVRLAPFYDVASILAYPQFDPRKMKLAMKIGDEYGLTDIRLSDWRKFSVANRVEEDYVVGRIKEMAKMLPDCLSAEIAKMHKAGITHKTLLILADALPKRATAIAAM